jgi:hypothetical protein
MTGGRLHPSTWILLAANLVPLIGVIFWHWDAFVLLSLYWLETGVIAFWAIIRIATIPPGALDDLRFQSGRRAFAPLAMAAFFAVHAGIFMGVHFLLLWVFFADDWAPRIHGPRDFIDQIVVHTGLWLPLLALFIGRGAAILFETAKPHLFRWLGVAERPPDARTPGPGETILLYIRIAVMQVTIMLGAWLALLIGTNTAFVLLVAVKTAMDLAFHRLADAMHQAAIKAKVNSAAPS